MIGIGEIAAIPFAVFTIPKFERKKIFQATMIIGALLSFGTSLVSVPSECFYCSEGVVQMVLIAFTKFTLVFTWSCLYNYMV